MKRLHILFIATALLFGGCTGGIYIYEDIENVLCIARFGIDRVELEDYTQSTYTYQVAVSMGGYTKADAVAQVDVDESYLEQYNSENESANYVLLPSSYYSIPDNRVTLTHKIPNKPVNVLFETAKMQAELDPAITYALPVSVSSPSGDKVNEDRNSTLIYIYFTES